MSLGEVFSHRKSVTNNLSNYLCLIDQQDNKRKNVVYWNMKDQAPKTSIKVEKVA